ncbi:MAG TPA: hypothetical protein VIT93_06485 [Dehalococcoidia bacterium]
MKLLPLALFTLIALALVACSGADGSDSTTRDLSADGLFVSNGVEVLSASADRFEQEINSLDGSLEMAIVADGMDLGVDADFAFEAPDKMHMALTMSGDDGTGVDLGDFGTTELLVRDGTYYFTMPLFGGWMSLSLDDAGLTGTDLGEIEDLLSTSSAFDYQALVDAFGGVDFVGEEEVDGRNMLYYSVSTELADALGALSGAYDSTSGGTDLFPVDDVTGPIEMDIWIGTDDYLPYLVTMDISLSTPEDGDLSLDMTMRIDAYNGDVTIPDAPSDAASFGDLFGGEGGEDPFGFGDLFEGP